MLAETPGTEASGGKTYSMVGGPVRTLRVNNDGTFTPVVNITALSNKYGVQFTFTILASTYDADGGPPETELRTEWVDAVCGHPHVVSFYTQQDQGPDQVLYNYAQIGVGPEGATEGDVVSVRMDHLNDPSTFGAIDASWNRQVDLGVS
jgi:hypothetical protein